MTAGVMGVYQPRFWLAVMKKQHPGPLSVWWCDDITCVKVTTVCLVTLFHLCRCSKSGLTVFSLHPVRKRDWSQILLKSNCWWSFVLYSCLITTAHVQLNNDETEARCLAPWQIPHKKHNSKYYRINFFLFSIVPCFTIGFVMTNVTHNHMHTHTKTTTWQTHLLAEEKELITYT